MGGLIGRSAAVAAGADAWVKHLIGTIVVVTTSLASTLGIDIGIAPRHDRQLAPRAARAVQELLHTAAQAERNGGVVYLPERLLTGW